MKEQSITSILEGRKVADNYIKDLAKIKRSGKILTPKLHTETLVGFAKELEKLGFESISDFYESNRLACLEEVKRCYRPVGECDCCVGRERGCLKNCFPTRSKECGKVVFSWDDFFEWQQFEGHSPEGCSMYFKEVDKPTFDIYWGMPEGLKPEVVRRFNRGNSNT